MGVWVPTHALEHRVIPANLALKIGHQWGKFNSRRLLQAEKELVVASIVRSSLIEIHLHADFFARNRDSSPAIKGM